MNQTRERTVVTTTHGRYLLELSSNEPAGLLVGYHGYGENAAIQLESLNAIPGSSAWIRCSIQGLHRFYYQKANRIVASWMTREDRELAIADNIAYVQSVVDQVLADGAVRTVVHAGFSQGAAMAYRAAVHSLPRYAGLIILGGDLPPDVAARSELKTAPILLGRGIHDTFYPQQKFAEDGSMLRALGADVTVSSFDGGHEWAPEFLAEAGNFLERLALSESLTPPTV